MTAQKKSPKTVSWPAIQLPTDPNGNVAHYVTAIPAKQLYNVSFVSRADQDPKEGFQRTLSEARAKSIAEYLDAGSIIPGAVILSAKAEAQLCFDAKNKLLSYKDEPKAFFVIDGQHRLFGAERATKNVVLAVSILTSLDLHEEARYFNDINGEQKGVPRTLQLEIQKFTEPKDSPDQLRIKIFHALNTRPDSPLANRLSPTKSVQGKLTHVPFKNAVQPLFDDALFQGLTDDQKIQLLINFLSALEDILVESIGDSKKLSNAAFFEAVFKALPGVLQHTVRQHHNYKKESLKDILSPIGKIDWNVYSGTNKKEIQKLSNHIGQLVAKSAPISNELL
ncbi:MAG: DGQHR domain-containing protein [Nibricoccus sp.]